jgi:hypothetical protein
LTKKSDSTGDDNDVFKNNTGNSAVTGPGDPVVKNKAQEVRIHSVSKQVGAPKTDAGTVNNERGGSGSGTGSGTKSSGKNFPPAYYNVRKLTVNSQPTTELHSITGDRRGSGVVNYNKLTPGFELKNDERQHTVKNFHILAMKQNVSTSILREGNEIRCVTYKSFHTFTGSEPVCVIGTYGSELPPCPADRKNGFVLCSCQT